MPQIVDPIDRIARAKGRDVLMVGFRAPKSRRERFDWEHCPSRQELIEWLDRQGIAWTPCYEMWSDGLIETPYTGELYIDVPYDRANEQYRQLELHLENPDGSPRIPHVLFFLLPLATALKNAHHDEPGYWDD